ncbi:unnamed protein product [Prorocentrum cordatum]|uniref:Uncharacterized protein n=1 Tax=Prorocentrum cordatum TaxID=2364126 RepID=A0ABN9WJL8_9DINO|nr:unnamed protein product [Polarella glacialis]
MLETDPLTLGKSHSFLERGSRPTSKFRFWRDVVERHKAMSAMFESMWDPAVWVVGPHVFILCAFGIIGVAGTVEGAKQQNPAAAGVWLTLSLVAIVATKQLLQRTDGLRDRDVLVRVLASEERLFAGHLAVWRVPMGY